MKSRLAHTPRYDAWVECLRAATDAPGAKTRLARYLAEAKGQSETVARVSIARVLNRGTRINAEDLLTIQEWMDR